MTVDVNDKFDFSDSVGVVKVFFDGINLRMKIFTRLFPDAIQVVSR